MNILAPLIALIVGLTLIANVSDYFVSSRETSKQNHMAMTKMDAAREMAPLVRNGYDLYIRNGNACPGATRVVTPINPTTARMCWPATNNGCVGTVNRQVCLAQGFLTSTQPAMPLLYRLLNPIQAYAQRALPTAQSPRAAAAASTGVYVGTPTAGAPAAATTFSADCSDGNTACITLAFCVGETRINGCNNTHPGYVIQTFALWNF